MTTVTEGNGLACITAMTAQSWASAAGIPPMTFQGNSNGDICKTHCSTTVFSGSLFLFANGFSQPNTGVTCYCFDNNVVPTDIRSSTSSSGTCTREGVKYMQNRGNDDNLLCYPGPGPGAPPAGSAAVSSYAACFTRCQSFAYSQILPRASPNNFLCICGASRPGPASDLNSCVPDFTLYSFENRLIVAPSTPNRKRDAMRRTRLQQRLAKGGDLEHCPAGLTACRIAKTDGAGYECVDTKTELESCGGCTYGVYGSGLSAAGTGSSDCTAMSGVASGGSTCRAGKCVAMACEEGHYLVDGECDLA